MRTSPTREEIQGWPGEAGREDSSHTDVESMHSARATPHSIALSSLVLPDCQELSLCVPRFLLSQKGFDLVYYTPIPWGKELESWSITFTTVCKVNESRGE